MEQETKICKGCGLNLPLSNFNKHSQTRDKLRAKCIECRRLEHIAYREANPEKIKEMQRICDARKVATPEGRERKRLINARYMATPEGKLKARERYKRHIERNGYGKRKYKYVKRSGSSASTKRWRQNNKDKANAQYAYRRARKKNATPSWLTESDKESMLELYTICGMFKIYTGLEYHVDHIVPLCGKTICGLHVPWNLRVSTSLDNLSKNNKLDESLAIDLSAPAYC